MANPTDAGDSYCASVGSIEFGSWLPGQDAGWPALWCSL